MKNLLRVTLFSASCMAASTLSLLAAPAEAGAIDIGQLMPSQKGQFVEVNLSSGLLKFAAKIAATQEPEAAELIAGLKSIRVNVVDLDASNNADVIAKIESVRAKLEADGWVKMVNVRQNEDAENVAVHVKQRSDDALDGLVVTVIDRSGQAVFVNIVGNIDPDQIAKLADKFDIAPLRKVKVKTAGTKTEL